MDPLDPLTEIIKSGQAFSSAIALERVIWLLMVLFFLSAISSSIRRGMKGKNKFGNKFFLSSLKVVKGQDKLPSRDK